MTLRSALVAMCIVGVALPSVNAQETPGSRTREQNRDFPSPFQDPAPRRSEVDELSRPLPAPQATSEPQLTRPRVLEQTPTDENATHLLPPNIILPGRPSNGRNQELEVPKVDADGRPLELRSINVPLTEAPLPERSVINANGKNITLVIRDGSLAAVLNAIADEMNLNVVSASDVTGQISITMHDVPLHNALDAILSVNGYRWVMHRNIIQISSLNGDGQLSPAVQGREVSVFRLDFAAASEVEKTVKGLLSPVGNVFVTAVDSLDKLKTREEVVVEDLPDYLDRIRAYIAQADQPPAQVLIEAHILQVQLSDDLRYGVDLQSLTSMAQANVSLQTNGIANPAASPGFILNIDGDHVDAVIEALKSTTDAKTLASPKVLAVNGQEAKIQIGQKLGYLTTTTTQTSTLQDVKFIDLGVVLTVTPVISRDGQILMTVKPEVSSGRINSTTGLPDQETTEVATTVMLPSGHAMLIGGLIKENDTDLEGKLPILGDIPVFGKLFQKRNRVKNRSEIIITLIPRIVPYEEFAQWRHSEEVQRASAPLLYGALKRVDRRRVEATLPNAHGYCDTCGISDDAYGKPMSCFPVPPVAFSHQGSGQFDQVPYLPMTPATELHIQRQPMGGHRSPREFLPPVNLQSDHTSQPTIRQTSGIVPDRPARSSKRSIFSGWRRSRTEAE